MLDLRLVDAMERIADSLEKLVEKTPSRDELVAALYGAAAANAVGVRNPKLNAQTVLDCSFFGSACAAQHARKFANEE